MDKSKKFITSLKSSSKTAKRLLGILWHEDKKLYIASVVAVIIPGVIPFINAYIYALMINFIVSVISGHHHSYELIYILIALRVLTLFIQDAAFTAQNRHTYIFNSRMTLIFYQAIMDQLSDLDLATIEDSDFQSLFESIRQSASYQPSEMLQNIFFSIQSIFQLVIAAGSLIFLNWIFAVVILVTAIPQFINQSKTAKAVYSIWAQNSPYRKRFSYLYWSLQEPRNVSELRLFSLNKYFSKEGQEISKKFTTDNNKTINDRFWSGVVSNSINVAGYGLVEVYLILNTLTKKISLGSLTYYTTALLNFQSGISGLLRNAAGVFGSTQYVQEIFDFLDLKPKLVSPPNAIKFSSKSAPLIEFRNVTFSYENSKKKILDNFSLVIKPGEKIAFVGENGAGKSTIIKLLCRLYDPTEGKILINNIDLKQLDIPSWHDHIGIIFQDYLKYEDSFEDNIWFGNIKKSKIMSEIKTAAGHSGADSLVKDFDKGYKQILGSRFYDGTELSVGQWQKVALSRGFYRNAPIFILDEPTSAIDAKAEYEIFRKIEKLASDKTAIIISHRFSTVRNADKIIVIENGKIIESGSHKTLMELNKIYASLFTMQAESYK
jgi:ATP-binding cassette subfamily B protein